MTVENLAPQNPYWEKVREYIFQEVRPWGVEFAVDPLRLPNGDFRKDSREISELMKTVSRNEMVKQYSWTIPDPVALSFVAGHMNGPAFDPMAGTGYWAYLLQQMGKDIICFDKDPMSENNHWHRESPVHTRVIQQEGIVSSQTNSDRILLLSWPPYGSIAGYNILRLYQGRRVIYIGEDYGGCCGDDQMFEEFENKWDEVDRHKPVQWWGLHDIIAIYDRKAISSNENRALPIAEH